MARQTIAKVTPKSPDAATIAANSADVAFTACDATNKEQFASTGRELVLFQNTGAGARTVTISSVADDLNRTRDVETYSIGAGEFALFGPFPLKGWRQTSDGNVYCEAEHAEVKILVIDPGRIL